jgi:carboxypeptidase Taq
MSNATQSYQTLVTTLREIALLGSAASVLHWDERTQMPVKGTEHRANQLSLISRLVHEQFTAPKVGELLASLEQSGQMGETHGDVAATVRETRRSYDRAVKLPASLVEEMAKTEILSQAAWVEARKHSDYAAFEPWLAKVLKLKLQEADCVGYKASRYDALLDPYEPDETAAGLTKVFESLREPLVQLVGKIGSSGRPAPLEILERRFPAAAQERLGRMAAEKVGFDFSAGRLDVSVHPFCSGIGPGDTRMTTRYDEAYFGDAFFGVLHETGHALYEQGLPAEHFGLPLGEAISLGIHESQSRLWENFVGRSRSFWICFLPIAREMFPEALKDVSEDAWYRAINDVRPSFIRTESDEATYNLHILLRFELEQAMVNGDLSTKDIPGAWNERMKKYFGITPPNDAKGCLQDTHWASGLIGYFPTYTLGNLYAAQFFEKARADLGDLDGQFAAGDFAPLLGWLRKNIHAHGRRYSARELGKRVTGQELAAEPLLRHLRKKANEVYGV